MTLVYKAIATAITPPATTKTSVPNPQRTDIRGAPPPICNPGVFLGGGCEFAADVRMTTTDVIVVSDPSEFVV